MLILFVILLAVWIVLMQHVVCKNHDLSTNEALSLDQNQNEA